MDCKHLFLLIVMTFLYMVAGMLIFRFLEFDNEKQRRTKLKEDFMNFIDNHRCIGMIGMAQLLDIVSGQTKEVRFLMANKTVHWWDYFGSLVFVTSAVTTIGYGQIAPKTISGIVATVVYSLFGIPLTLVMLKKIGDKLHGMAKRVYQIQHCKKKWVNQTVNVSIVALVGFSLVMVIPSLLLVHVEKWTMVESLYYCFITLSTIGFGDYLPEGGIGLQTQYHHIYYAFQFIWLFFGLAHVSLMITCISNAIVKNATTVEKHTLTRLEAEARRLRMQRLKNRQNHFDLTVATVEGTASSECLDVTLLSYRTRRKDKTQSNLTGNNNPVAMETTMSAGDGDINTA